MFSVSEMRLAESELEAAIIGGTLHELTDTAVDVLRHVPSVATEAKFLERRAQFSLDARRQGLSLLAEEVGYGTLYTDDMNLAQVQTLELAVLRAVTRLVRAAFGLDAPEPRTDDAGL